MMPIIQPTAEALDEGNLAEFDRLSGRVPYLAEDAKSAPKSELPRAPVQVVFAEDRPIPPELCMDECCRLAGIPEKK